MIKNTKSQSTVQSLKEVIKTPKRSIIPKSIKRVKGYNKNRNMVEKFLLKSDYKE